MRFQEDLLRLERLFNLISRKSTGPAEKLAEKFEVHRATIFRYIKLFRDNGLAVEYCPERLSFYFVESLSFNDFLNILLEKN